MSDKLTIGNAVIGSPLSGGVLHACQKCGTPGATLFFPGGYLCPDCAHPAPDPDPPKPPKRVAAQVAVAISMPGEQGAAIIRVVANDGTLWKENVNAHLDPATLWTRLPDLPQE